MKQPWLITAGGLALLLPLLAFAGCGATPTPLPTPTHTARLSTATPVPTPTPIPTLIPTATPNPVVALTEQGIALFWKSDFDGAEAVLQEALAVDDKAVDAYKALALLYYFQLGKEAEALEAAEEAVSLAPTDPGAQAVLVRALLHSYRYEEALEAAELAVELDPESAIAHMVLARAHQRLCNHGEALEAAQRGVELDSGSSWAHFDLAQVYGKMWLKNESLAELHTAAALQPSFAPWYAQLADVYWRMLDNEVQAREYLAQALTQDEGYVWALALLAEIETDAENYEVASELCDRIKDLAPDANFGHLCEGTVYQTQELYEDAIGEYEAAVALEPDADEGYRRLAWVYALQNEYDLAIAEYEQLLDRFPRDAGLHTGLAYATLWSGEAEDALVHIERAIDLDPYNPWRQAVLADVYNALGETDQAEAAYQKAIEMDPEEAAFLSQLAGFYQQQNRAEQALRTRERAVALDPGSGTLHYELGWALSSGDYRRALEHLQQALDLGDDRDTVYSMLGLTYTQIGSYEEAHQVYEDGLGSYPDSVVLHLSLGSLFMIQEQCEQAVAEFELVLEEDPGNELALTGWQDCDAILHPQPTPVPDAPAPPSAGAITQAEAQQLATDVVEETGASIDEMMFEVSEGVNSWIVSYRSQLTPDSDAFNQQQRQIVLGLSEITVRIEPSVGSLGVLASDSTGQNYNGVVVLGLFAEMWQDGTFSDEEFAETWFIIEQ